MFVNADDTYSLTVTDGDVIDDGSGGWTTTGATPNSFILAPRTMVRESARACSYFLRVRR